MSYNKQPKMEETYHQYSSNSVVPPAEGQLVGSESCIFDAFLCTHPHGALKRKTLNHTRVLETYSSTAVSEGIEALVTTRVTIMPKSAGPNETPSIHSQTGLTRNRKFFGAGSDTDILTVLDSILCVGVEQTLEMEHAQ